MFALALLMAAAAPVQPAVLAPPVHRTVAGRRVRRAPVRQHLVPVRMNILAPCDVNPSRLGCRTSADQRYRLRNVGPDEPLVDNKTHAIEIDNKRRECGVVGAEVCPTNGAQVLKVDLGPPTP